MLLCLVVSLLSLLEPSHAAPPSPKPHSLEQSDLGGPSRLNCVPTAALWEGIIHYSDCLTAWGELHDDRSRILDRLYAFYTTSSGFEPPPGQGTLSWKLPSRKTIGACTLQIRMVRDFHPRELPLHHNSHDAYVHPTLFPPAGLSTWSSIFQEAKRVIDNCVRKGQPGFSANGYARTSQQDWMPVGIFLWATNSLIAGDYRDDVEHSGQEGGNSTVATA